MKAVLQVCVLALILAGCACEKGPSAANNLPVQASAEFVRQVGAAMQADEIEAQSVLPFSTEQIQKLRSYVFAGPPGAINPLYYDRIKNIESREVVRTYYDWYMDPKRSEVIRLSEERFWDPIAQLARYYVRFGNFPKNSTLDPIVLEGVLNAK